MNKYTVWSGMRAAKSEQGREEGAGVRARERGGGGVTL